MAIEKFVEVVEKLFGGEAKEISEVDWSTVSQEALDNNTFAHGEPFYLICPEELWSEIGRLPFARSFCACLDFEGNPIPNCVPKPPLSPFLIGICIDVHNPSSYNLSQGRRCYAQGDSWYQLTCVCPCLG